MSLMDILIWTEDVAQWESICLACGLPSPTPYEEREQRAPLSSPSRCYAGSASMASLQRPLLILQRETPRSSESK